MAPAMFTDRPLAVEIRRAAVANGARSSREEVGRILDASTAAQEDMDTNAVAEERATSHNVDEVNVNINESSVSREEIGERRPGFNC